MIYCNCKLWWGVCAIGLVAKMDTALLKRGQQYNLKCFKIKGIKS